MSGRVVMAVYRNAPDKTRETNDEEGWLHSGDIGEFDDDAFMKIVDRKKELIINAAGKNMSPANIEAKVKAASPPIGQAVAIGDRRPYNVALIVLDPDATQGFAKQHGLPDASPAALAEEPAVIEAVEAGVKQANEQLARVEQIKKFKILPEDLSQATGELTPTLKVKRNVVAQKFADEVENLYAS